MGLATVALALLGVAGITSGCDANTGNVPKTAVTETTDTWKPQEGFFQLRGDIPSPGSELTPEISKIIQDYGIVEYKLEKGDNIGFLVDRIQKAYYDLTGIDLGSREVAAMIVDMNRGTNPVVNNDPPYGPWGFTHNWPGDSVNLPNIPGLVEKQDSTQEAEQTLRYIIQYGDTLYQIAIDLGINYYYVLEHGTINGNPILNPDRIEVGGTLEVPRP